MLMGRFIPSQYFKFPSVNIEINGVGVKFIFDSFHLAIVPRILFVCGCLLYANI